VSSKGELALVERLRADLYELVAVDVVSLPDATLRSELVELLAAANQITAAIAARVASFDTRGLADDDAGRTAAVWLRACRASCGARRRYAAEPGRIPCRRRACSRRRHRRDDRRLRRR
jgi:hypothetical protein